MKKIYETTIVNTGGRAGEVHSLDESFSYQVTSPVDNKEGTTNPEQLFAAAYSACFNGALELVMGKHKNVHPSTVTAHVSLYSDPKDGFHISVILEVHIDDIDINTATDLVNEAHQVCPYSKATRNNIEVELKIV
ncbi:MULTISPECIES: organic hydroperoxide resistance protein [Vagococcus]|uniref:Organic hydroperoxide resistance protein n=1 Tax=Vagococcus fluvialis bH819 TaxID=1255619 RepID=A0A1X6WK50_9ENTE|nr:MULTISPECIES: organic hydroperoxide resistance protein [Vagococcus]SLM84691.1 Organic hydroperoxide resistance protein [Vagococcus fluvialis bH819]HCM89845.1 organic hydroperoxide resistance protein [Vagococcus sp.]